MTRLREKVMLRKVDEECILLDPMSGEYFGLDAVGSRMLELVLAGQRREAVVAALSQEYEAATDRLRADLSALLRELGDRGLVINDQEP